MLKIYKSLYIPTNFDIIFLKNKIKNNLTIILYNNNFSITLSHDFKKLKFDLESYCLIFEKNLNNKFNLRVE